MGRAWFWVDSRSCGSCRKDTKVLRADGHGNLWTAMVSWERLRNISSEVGMGKGGFRDVGRTQEPQSPS